MSIDTSIIQRFDQLATEVRSGSAKYEQNRQLPEALANQLADADLFRLLVPSEYGGAEAHPSTFIELLYRSACADGAVGWCLMIGNTTGLLSATLPDHWARMMYSDKQTAVTVGVTAPMGRAEVEGDGLRVSGRWPFGSGSNFAHWICGGCTISDGGEVRMNRFGQPETALVFFTPEEVKIHDNWQVSGLCGTGSNDIEVNDVLVPEGRWATLGGRPRVDAPLFRFPTLGLLAMGVSAVSLGIAQRAIEEFIHLATDKVPTGSTRSLGNRASAQKDLALAQAGVRSAYDFIHSSIDRAWEQAVREGKLPMETKAELRLAAANATWSAVDAVDRLYHAAGGSSIYHKNALQRCFRDVHVTTQHIMVAQPIFEVVGKVGMGMDPKSLL